ncbi:unnamed protein product [Acanthoscelides obtectus]|uniref:Uncharacterized protein n=1 Tax=Acanthoscelides obtectus TaxID=200917 RepID=A0A9P0JUJ3_ACAOB|nr:unnamed protein product [Acanthoscelides obtectus]CAK1661911.1 hypothetical protein AOBTE_LOCUS22874 [Acanthoscelides obtectus]
MEGNEPEAEDSINKPSLPTIIIRPKSQQNIGKNKEEVQRLINPCEINVGIRNIKETKKGNIVLKCDTEQELERLKKSAESKLKGVSSVRAFNTKVTGVLESKSVETVQGVTIPQNVKVRRGRV